MEDTNWADRIVGGEVPEDDDDREDQFEDSVLDLVFAVGDAKEWSPESDIIVRDGDFPDSGDTSDHRPVEGRFQLPDIVDLAEAATADETEDLLQQILKRLEKIEKRLDDLED